MPERPTRLTVRVSTAAIAGAVAASLFALRALQHAWQGGKARWEFLTSRLDDPSFWMFLAAVFSIGKVIEGKLAPRPASPLYDPARPHDGRTDRFVGACWLASVVMLLGYFAETWYAGEAAFHPKAKGWRPVLERTPDSALWGGVHWLQMVDAALTLLFVFAGCAAAAAAIRRLRRAREILVRETPAAVPNVAEAVSYIASAGLGPTFAFGLWLGTWSVLRKYVPMVAALGKTEEWNLMRVAHVAGTVALLCTPYLIVYAAAWRLLWPTFSYKHRPLRLFVLGFYGATITARLRAHTTHSGPDPLDRPVTYPLPADGPGPTLRAELTLPRDELTEVRARGRAAADQPHEVRAAFADGRATLVELYPPSGSGSLRWLRRWRAELF